MRRKANQLSVLESLFWIRRLPNTRKRRFPELERLLGLSRSALKQLDTSYTTRSIPKADGSDRKLHVPNDQLKAVQRTLVRQVLGRYRTHQAAHGYVQGRSNISPAAIHRRSEVIVRLDIRDFFANTSTDDGYLYFRRVGWSSLASEDLARICFVDGGLPQGAPSSPVLSNILNYRLDQRLTGLASRFEARYSRYVDDLTFSWPLGARTEESQIIRTTQAILDDEGYELQHNKTAVMRRSGRQRVTGLVVNDDLNMPRQQRRQLRAARHRLTIGQPATWTTAQLDGFDAYLSAIDCYKQQHDTL